MITDKKENIRTEYLALNAYGGQVVSFRFQLVGFYMAAVGLLAVSCIEANTKGILLLWISVVLWLLELRNRSLIDNISKRGMQIECEYWGYRGDKSFEAFIGRQNRPKYDLNDYDFTTIMGVIKVRWPLSHTLVLDIMYMLVIIYAFHILPICRIECFLWLIFILAVIIVILGLSTLMGKTKFKSKKLKDREQSGLQQGVLSQNCSL